jgi:hypothetical protein
MDAKDTGKGNGKHARTGLRKHKVLVRVCVAMGLLLLWVELVFAYVIVMRVLQGASMSAVLAVLLPNSGRIVGLILITLLELICLAILGVTLILVVNEGCHVLGGKMVGFRFVMLVLGPMKIVSTRGGVKIMRSSRQDPGPVAIVSVPMTSDNLRWRMVAMALAGSLTNVALWLVCWWLSGVTQGATSTFLALTSLFSLFVVVYSLLPFKSSGRLSVGAYLKMLAMGGPEAERLCCILMIMGASLMGKRPREWDADWIRRITALDDSTLLDASACQGAFYWALDMGNVEEGERYLMRAIAHPEVIPSAVRPAFLVDAAFFYAYYRHDPATARGFLDEAGELRGKRRHMWVRAEAATLAAEGNRGEARRLAQESLEDITRDPLIGPGWELDREWIEALAGDWTESGSRRWRASKKVHVVYTQN